MIRKSRALWLLAILSVPGGVRAQSCPPADGSSLDAKAPSALHGTIRYHEGTRPWLGFVPDQPVCGEKEIELAFSDTGWEQAKRMRGCGVTVRGRISDSPTVYYAANLNVFNPEITPDGGCHLFPADPDSKRSPIPAAVNSYRVTIYIDVRDNKPLRGEVRLAESPRIETDWQSYADWWLNGEEDLAMSCRKGFRLVSFKGSAPDRTISDDGWISITSSELGPASLTIECHRQ